MRGNPKPEPYKRVKARRRRNESKVKKSVREQVDARDGYCLLGPVRPMSFAGYGLCEGPSEWAHIGPYRRSKTRGMAPERRHTTTGSAMLCQTHHRAYDAHAFDIQPTTDRGMDGPFRIVGNE